MKEIREALGILQYHIDCGNLTDEEAKVTEKAQTAVLTAEETKAIGRALALLQEHLDRCEFAGDRANAVFIRAYEAYAKVANTCAYPRNCRRPGDCSHTCGFCYEDAIVTLEDGKPYCKKHAEYLT